MFISEHKFQSTVIRKGEVGQTSGYLWKECMINYMKYATYFMAYDNYSYLIVKSNIYFFFI